MPPSSYRAAHPNSAITAEQLAILRNYLTPRSQEPPATVSQVQAADREYLRWIEDNGYRPVGYHREVYLEYCPEKPDQGVTELQIEIVKD